MTCPICGGLGIIKKDDKDGYEIFVKYCECPIGRTKEAGLIHYKLAKANIYEKYWNMELDSLQKQPLEAHVKFVDKIKELTTNLPLGYTLILYGDSGVGKTMGVSLLLKHILLNTALDCYFVTMPELLSSILRDVDITDELSYYDMLKEVDVLAIDDIGLTAIQKEFPQITVAQLLKDRMSSNRRTILIMSNSKLLTEQYKFITKIVPPSCFYDVPGKNGWLPK
jgi:DNA replication protein DnaC